MPVSVTLLQWIEVGGYGFSRSHKVSLTILAYFAFRNSAPSSASSANNETNVSIWQSVNIAPLRIIRCLSCGFHPRIFFSSAQILAS